MKKLLLASMMSLALAATALWAADFWKEKKYTEWSEKEAQKMLRDSPWARPVEVRLGSPGGELPSGGGGRGGRRGGGGGGAMPMPSAGGGAGGFEGEGNIGGGARGGGLETPQAPPTQTVVVRFHTALPLKQAVVRLRYGNEAASSPEAAQILARQETQYVVGIAGLPLMMLRGNPAKLKSNALLRIKGRPAVEAEDVKADRDQRGANLYLFFPKTQPGSHVITLEDKEVEIQVKLGSTEIRRKFRLKDMVFDGKLEI